MDEVPCGETLPQALHDAFERLHEKLNAMSISLETLQVQKLSESHIVDEPCPDAQKLNSARRGSCCEEVQGNASNKVDEPEVEVQTPNSSDRVRERRVDDQMHNASDELVDSDAGHKLDEDNKVDEHGVECQKTRTSSRSDESSVSEEDHFPRLLVETSRAGRKSAIHRPELGDLGEPSSSSPKVSSIASRPAPSMLNGNDSARMDCARRRGHAHLQRANSVMPLPKSRLESVQQHLVKLTNAPLFGLLVFVVIVANSVILGVAAQLEADGMVEYLVYTEIATCACGICFIAEFLLRMMADGPRQHLCTGKAWNWFDAAIALESFVSCISFFSNGDWWTHGKSKNLGLIRLAKALRVLRMIRVIQFAVALRHLLMCIVVALKLLVWASVLLCIIVYVFAVFFTSLQDPTSSNAVGHYFGSIYISMITLVQSICGGLSWSVATEVLRQESRLYELAFLLYIFITYLTVLNVVTGVFTAVAMKASESDPDLIAMSQADNRRRKQEITERLFKYLDVDRSEGITLEEVEQAWDDESMVGFLSALQLNAETPWLFFSLLDTNEDGVIDQWELGNGVSRLGANSMNVEVAKLQLGQQWVIQCLEVLTQSSRPGSIMGEKRASIGLGAGFPVGPDALRRLSLRSAVSEGLNSEPSAASSDNGMAAV